MPLGDQSEIASRSERTDVAGVVSRRRKRPRAAARCPKATPYHLTQRASAAKPPPRVQRAKSRPCNKCTQRNQKDQINVVRKFYLAASIRKDSQTGHMHRAPLHANHADSVHVVQTKRFCGWMHFTCNR